MGKKHHGEKDPKETKKLINTNNLPSKASVFYLIKKFLIPLLKNTFSSIPISFKCVSYIFP